MATMRETEQKWGDNPYIGPRTFSPDEADKFYGRDREARNLTGMIVSHRTMLFYAQSGAGKSSLINAKLIPSLIEEGFEVLPVARVSGQSGLDVKVDNIFVYNLISSLHQKREEPPQFPSLTLADFLDNLVHDNDLFVYDEQYVYADDVELKPRILLIDQFEEILTTNTPFWEQRDLFFQQLSEALALDDQLWVVMVLREDFVAGLDPYRHYFEDELRGRFYMQQLDRESALAAITKPAEKAKRPFTPIAAQILVDNLREIRQKENVDKRFLGAYVEPVQLQAVCYQMWEKLKEGDGEYITVQDVREHANISEALTNFYEDTIADTVANTSVSEPDLRNWFDVSLITEAGTRNAVYRGKETVGDLPTPIADYVKNKFIIRENVRPGGIWYEIVHDRFVQPILKANREWRQEQPLIRLADQWDKSDRNESQLLSRRQIAEYTKVNENWKALGPLIRVYVSASKRALRAADAAAREQTYQQELAQKSMLAAAERERAEGAELAAARQKKLAGISIGIGVFAVIVTVIVFIMLGMTQKATKYAEQQAATASVAQVAAESDAMYAAEQSTLAFAAQETAVSDAAYAAEQATAAFEAQETAVWDAAYAATAEAEANANREQLAIQIDEMRAAQATADVQESVLSEALQTQAELLEQLLAVTATATPTVIFVIEITKTPESSDVPATDTPYPTEVPEQDLTIQLENVRATQTAVAIRSAAATTILVGVSNNAVPIEALRIGNGPENYLFIGGIHAGMAPSTVSLVEELAAYYEKNPEAIPSHVTLYFIPSLNPDSPEAVGTYEGRLNANGVDLNRNWGCGWQEDIFLGDTLYKGAGGSEPFSEPETMALKKFIEQIEPRTVILWDAPDRPGFVSAGQGCEADTVSKEVGSLYAESSGYQFGVGEPKTAPGAIHHWLDQQGIPTFFVVLPRTTKFDLDLHVQSVDEVLNRYDEGVE